MPPDQNAEEQATSAPTDAPQKESRREKIVTGVLIGVIVVIVAGVLAPARNWISGSFDEIHDAFLSYNARTIDNLAEYLKGSDIWAGRPQVQGKALDYLTNLPDGNVVSVTGSTPARVTVDQLISSGVRYEQAPVFVIGRVLSVRDRGGDPASDYSASEVEIRGVRPTSVVYVGVGAAPNPPDDVHPGDVVLVRGVVTGLGKTRLIGGPVVPTAYFTELDLENPAALTLGDNAIRPPFKDAIAKFRRETR